MGPFQGGCWGCCSVWIESRRPEGSKDEGCFALVDTPKCSRYSNKQGQTSVSVLSESRGNVLN